MVVNLRSQISGCVSRVRVGSRGYELDDAVAGFDVARGKDDLQKIVEICTHFAFSKNVFLSISNFFLNSQNVKRLGIFLISFLGIIHLKGCQCVVLAKIVLSLI